MIANEVLPRPDINTSGYDKYIEKIRKYILPLVVVLLIATSWIGFVDRHSENYVNGAIKQALIVYGTARAVNSVISVLQTVSIPGVTIGEALDPINDLVERFSAIMELAIGSLVVQKMLVEITTNDFFKYALTLSGIVFLASMLLGYGEKSLIFSKIFITFVFLRFAVVLALLLNGVVDAKFIDQKVTDDLTAVQVATPAISVEVEPLKPIEPEVLEPTSEPNAGLSNDAEPAVKEGWMARIKKKVGKGVEGVKVLAGKLNPKLIKEKIERIVPNMLNLMAILVLKSIILPLIFLYLMKQMIFLVWNVRLEDFFEKNAKSKIMISQGDKIA